VNSKGPRVRKILVPLCAASSVGLFPASLCVASSALLPLPDSDGRCKALLHIQLEEALSALGWPLKPAAEEASKSAQSDQQSDSQVQVALVYSDAEQRRAIERYFSASVPARASDEIQAAQKQLQRIASLLHWIEFAPSDERDIGGDAIWSARKWIGREPFLLLNAAQVHLSSHPERDQPNRNFSCLRQLIDLYAHVAAKDEHACVSALTHVAEEELHASWEAPDAPVSLIAGNLVDGIDLYGVEARRAAERAAQEAAQQRALQQLALQNDGISRFVQRSPPPALSPTTPLGTSAALATATFPSPPLPRLQGEVVQLHLFARNPTLEATHENFLLPFGESDFIGAAGAHVLSAAVVDELQKQQEQLAGKKEQSQSAAAAPTADSLSSAEAAPAESSDASASVTAADSKDAASSDLDSSAAATTGAVSLSLHAALSSLATAGVEQHSPCFGLLWLGRSHAPAEIATAFSTAVAAFTAEGEHRRRAQDEARRAAEAAAKAAAAAAAAASAPPVSSPTVQLTNAALTRRTAYD